MEAKKRGGVRMDDFIKKSLVDKVRKRRVSKGQQVENAMRNLKMITGATRVSKSMLNKALKEKK